MCLFLALFVASLIHAETAYTFGTEEDEPWFESMLTTSSGNSNPCGQYSSGYTSLSNADPTLSVIFAYDKEAKNFEAFFSTKKTFEATGGDDLIKTSLYNYPWLSSNITTEPLFVVQSFAINTTTGSLTDFFKFEGVVQLETTSDGKERYKFRIDSSSKKLKFDFDQLDAFDPDILFNNAVQTFATEAAHGNPEGWSLNWTEAYQVPVVLSFQSQDSSFVFPFQCAYAALAIVAGRRTCVCCDADGEGSCSWTCFWQWFCCCCCC